MDLIRNKDNRSLLFIEGNKVVMELSWFYDEFIWLINVCYPIVFTREIDESFYMQLNMLMDSDYQFFIDDKLSFKEKDKIQWLSDQCCDLDNQEETDRINRLVIERINETFVIRVENPFLLKNNINRSSYAIAFSPVGNGYMVKNIEMNTNFQDDIVSLFNNTMDKGGISNSEEPQKKMKF